MAWWSRAQQWPEIGTGQPQLRDPERQRELAERGYTRFPFLGAAEVDVLRALWDRVRPPKVAGIYSNVHGLSARRNRRVDQTITEAFAPAFLRTFEAGTLGGASFLVKGVGPDSASTIHQDWSVVDEEVDASYSIWCPLVDVDEGNGALVVVPGSHRLPFTIRSMDIPSLYLDFEEVEATAVSVPARAGDAVVYAHRLYHGSRPNRTDEIRVAAVSGVFGPTAQRVHHRRRGDEVEVLAVERAFYIEHVAAVSEGATPPSARIVGRRPMVPGHDRSVVAACRPAEPT